MKIIVYTTNIGNYDSLHPAPAIPGVSFLYFTDGEAPAGWTKMSLPWIPDLEDRKLSRFYKINAHLLPAHDISIYIDACYEFSNISIKEILEEFKPQYDIMIPAHPFDKDPYTHAEMCMRNKLGNPQIINRQMERYRSMGLPKNCGLTENSIIIRKNNLSNKKLNRLWWKEYLAGSQRDQLSLPYAIWKVKPKLGILPFSARENKYLLNWAIHNKLREWKQKQDN